MTPGGFARLSAELDRLVKRERPELVATVAWAASNGDRSENGDYIYGKKRLREIDRRIRFLIKRLDVAEVVDPAARRDDPERRPGLLRRDGDRSPTRAVTSAQSRSSASTRSTPRAVTSAGSRRWRARCCKARVGDTVLLHTPGGSEEIEIVDVRYDVAGDRRYVVRLTAIATCG